MSIKRYLTGKLALACQILIYSIRLKEKVQKHPKISVFWKRSVLDGLNRGSKWNGENIFELFLYVYTLPMLRICRVSDCHIMLWMYINTSSFMQYKHWSYLCNYVAWCVGTNGRFYFTTFHTCVRKVKSNHIKILLIIIWTRHDITYRILSGD